MSQVRLITLDPGHFHAALVQKEMYPAVASQVHVYAPLGPDLLAHLQRIAGFNSRKEKPTTWELEVHTSADYLLRLPGERPGNVVVLAGRNRIKIDYILAALQSGMNVLADKPWIIAAKDQKKLKTALDMADQQGLIAYDIMTERFEITSILQKELVNDADTFGSIVLGTPEEPGVFMESMHYLMKTVAGVPLRRPAWFFDVGQQGEGLTDVGTHLVDLIPWMLFPSQGINYHEDIRLVTARRWPTILSRSDYQRVTGEAEFPSFLAGNLRNDQLDYFCNTMVSYTVRGIQVKLNILWDYEAATGAGDTHLAIFRGTRSSIEVRQGKEQNYRPELYVVPNRPEDRPAVLGAVRNKLDRLNTAWPGLGVTEAGDQVQVKIPDGYRVGHEAHFAEVTKQFLAYLENPRALPAWEKPSMLAKYHVTTEGVALSH